jgi:hypothetical protein
MSDPKQKELLSWGQQLSIFKHFQARSAGYGPRPSFHFPAYFGRTGSLPIVNDFVDSIFFAFFKVFLAILFSLA